MKVVRYTGGSTVRRLSSVEIESAFGISTRDLEVDTRVSHLATVSNALAKKLVELGEFEIASDADEEDEDREHEAREAREAADKASAAMEEERRAQEAAQIKATIESGENTRPGGDPSTAPEAVSPTTKAAPRPSRTTTT